MRRSVRDRLVELLFLAFEDPRKGDSLFWLRLLSDFSNHGRQAEVPLAELFEAGGAALPGREDGGKGALACMISPGGLVRVRRADTREELSAGLPPQSKCVPWVIGFGPDVHPDLADVCERVTAYANVLAVVHAGDPELSRSDPLRRAAAQAAACFNAGLFFEAHEHLERIWRSQPRGETRRFLQGIIQISVGFHHARRGSYDGAVNQLAKGLEKTAGVAGEAFGLDWEAFWPAVAEIRDGLVRRGRSAMRPMPLVQIPSMPLSGVWSPGSGRGHSNARSEERP